MPYGSIMIFLLSLHGNHIKHHCSSLRNRNVTLTPDLELEGRPRHMYKAVLQLLTDVFDAKISAEDLLAETVRCLLVYRNERQQRMSAALEGLKTTQDMMPLAAESIV